MPYVWALTGLTSVVSSVLAGGVQRWLDALAKISDGDYDGAALRQDVLASLADAARFWGALLPYGQQPMLPVAAFPPIRAAVVPGSSAAAIFFLERRVPQGVVPTATSLIRVGGAGEIPVQVAVTNPIRRDEIAVTLALSSGGSPPSAGLYLGIVLVDQQIVGSATLLVEP